MDLPSIQIKRLCYVIQRSFLFGFITLLTACAVSNNPQQEAVQPAIEQVSSEQESAEVESLPLTPELVYYVLMAEIAGQRGEISVAAELYEKAAYTVSSPALAGRWAQIANFTRDNKRIKRAIDRWIEVDPSDADVYIMQVPFLMIKGDYDAVVEAVDTALELSPDKSRQYLARVADNLTEKVSQDQALAIIQKLRLYQDNDVEALFTYARLAAFFKYYADALPVAEMVVKLQPNREDAQILKADILQRLGRGDEGLALLKKAADKESASDDLKFSYAKLLGENNKLVEASRIFEQLNVERPANEEVLFALGLIALERKDGKTAKSYFNQLVKLGDHGQQAAYFMGLSEELNEDVDSALIWFASVSTTSQRYQSAQSRYINLLADNGQLEKARLHLKLLRKENSQQVVKYYLFEATFLRERNQNQAAFDLYTEALLQYPKDIGLLYGRAMVAEPLHRLSVLEEDLTQVLTIEPNNSSALNALGYTLTDRTDRHKEALLLIQRAVELKPDDPFYLDSLGWVHYRLGNLDEAIRHLRRAVMLQDDAEFVAHLGEVLWHQGKRDEAKQVWQQGFNQDADNALLNETMNRFGQ